MEDLISLINQLPKGAASRTLPLLDIRNQIDNTPFNRYDLGVCAANMFLEMGRLEEAKELYEKRGLDLGAANVLIAQEREDEAKELLIETFGNFERYSNGDWDIDEFMDFSKYTFTNEELENFLDYFVSTAEENNFVEDLNFQEDLHLLDAYVAKQTGNHERVEEIYQESKAYLRKNEKELYDETHEVDKDDELWYVVEEANRHHAKLCEVIGKYEEALKSYFEIGRGEEAPIFDEKYSSVLESMSDEQLEKQYNSILEYSLNHVRPPDYIRAALALEKLGREQEARNYFEEAIAQNEEKGLFYNSYVIAKGKGMKNKTEFYEHLMNKFYEKGLLD